MGSIKITTAADRIRQDGLQGKTSSSSGLTGIQRAALRAQEATQNLEPYAASRTGKASGVSSNGMSSTGAQNTSAPAAPAGSPVSQAARSMAPAVTPEAARVVRENDPRRSELFQKVNEDTDTVYGQLKKHTDFSSPAMVRAAQQAKEQAAARGLTSSSIAIGNATGAVVDRAGQFATEDARIYNDRKTENQRAATHLESTAMDNRTQRDIARLDSDTRIDVAEIQRDTTLQTQQSENENRLALQRTQDAASMARLRVDTGSRESIAELEIESRAMEQELDRQSRERQTQISADNQWQIAQFQQEAQNDRQKADQYNDIFRDYNTAVMNIDLQATAASQKEQLSRINDTFRIRLEAGGFIEQAAGIAPAVEPTISVFQGGRFGSSF